ncbi:MAG: hypothetical protein PHO62_07650 [Sulfurimonas sp.]|uniref:hypothetical protein n=1 Tax=Sulfurimonas sp. TaxID=2022749 RepID=UPI002604B9C2|nr:hypothetical protein [Sulfurimonas sp.]MDD5373280.1 hypothetical protein [Sulfurimonas sp.]
MIQLNTKEIDFILAKLELDTETQNLVKSGSLSDEIADDIRDLCTEKLDVSGYDEDYNLTEEGEMLNDLIDKLYIG